MMAHYNVYKVILCFLYSTSYIKMQYKIFGHIIIVLKNTHQLLKIIYTFYFNSWMRSFNIN